MCVCVCVCVCDSSQPIVDMGFEPDVCVCLYISVGLVWICVHEVEHSKNQVIPMSPYFISFKMFFFLLVRNNGTENLTRLERLYSGTTSWVLTSTRKSE